MSERVFACPDLSTYSMVVQAPDRCFTDDELRTATFARSGGHVRSWAGSNAVVYQAQLATGESRAVRFMLRPNPHAAARYEAIARHGVAERVPSLARTRWLPAGLRIGAAEHPVLEMEWIDGRELHRRVDDLVADPDGRAGAGGVAVLAATWVDLCRGLVRAGIGHGDVHAGNVLVVDERRPGGPLRLIDYDGMWVPGLAVPRLEDGHPAFNHPARRPGATGPHVDAFASTLTYLSLRAIAADRTLWRYHGADDTLLFEAADLRDPPGRDVWEAIGACADPQVRALGAETAAWLADHAERHRTLDEALAAAAARAASPPTIANVWRAGRSAPTAPTVAATPAATAAPVAPPAPGQQAWPPHAAATPPGPAPAGHSPTAPAPPAEPAQTWPHADAEPKSSVPGGSWWIWVAIIVAVVALLAR